MSGTSCLKGMGTLFDVGDFAFVVLVDFDLCDELGVLNRRFLLVQPPEFAVFLSSDASRPTTTARQDEKGERYFEQHSVSPVVWPAVASGMTGLIWL